MVEKNIHDILFSIIVPVYNAQKTLEKCIWSILNQIYDNLELLLIDDGSTDSSLSLCCRFAEIDNRVKIFHLSNGGVSRARNFGLDNVSGDFVAFVDSDDYIRRDFLQEVYNELKKGCFQLVIVGVNEIKKKKIIKHSCLEHSADKIGKKEFLKGIFEPDMYYGYLCNKVFDINIIKSNEIRLDETVSICEDVLFCFKYGKLIRNAAVIKKMLYMYVQNQNSATHKLDRNRIWSEEIVADYLANDTILNTDVSLKICISSFCCKAYMHCIYKGDFKNAVYDRRSIQKLIKKTRVIGIGYCDIYTKLQYYLLRISPIAAYHLYRLLRAIRGKTVK